MLSKSKIKYLQSLQQKKYRQKSQAFIVEGEKMAQEVLRQDLFKVHSIYATEQWINTNYALIAQYKSLLTTVAASELKKISTLKTPNQVLIELAMPQLDYDLETLAATQNLVLENIQDPGNMGTIIRIADWFGIPHIFCSKGCVDIYNPKVIQATMGGFLRIRIFYVDLEELLEQNKQIPVYGAVLGGENVYEMKMEKGGFMLIGNEGRGLSESITKYLTHRVTIPKFGEAESLNAAVATGVLCALWREKIS